MQAYHNTINYKYRFPLGAVRTGEKVYLGIKILDTNVENVYLRIYGEGFLRDIRMDVSKDLWYTDITMPDTAGAYFYYFKINLEEGEIYYCGDCELHCGYGGLSHSPYGAFQLTVYDKGFETPSWMKSSVMYQIFPDRFKRSDLEKAKARLEYHKHLGRSVYLHEDFSERAKFLASEGEEHYTPNDFFGGDIEGIISSLDYLKELGIDVIYLNPVFEANSNHRYNTADYYNIDPVLATEEDFCRLVLEARTRSIRIVLDGVFSHTGDDSKYFDRYSRYDAVGAYESKQSPYYSWYKFSDYPKKYKSWWGFDSLPEIDKSDKNWQKEIISGKDNVLEHWLKRGVSGFRLDVADELPDAVIEEIRKSAKKQSKNNAVIGEVWEDATTKQSYGKTRTYAFGRGLDSVMNYPLRNAIVDFLLNRTNAMDAMRLMISQWQNYPKPMYYSLMNLLSSHDIPRIVSALAAHFDINSMSREHQAHFMLTEQQLRHAYTLNKIAASIIFALPGMPSLYYGDETGMQGLMDPFNRETFRTENAELTEHYKYLSKLRHENPCLTQGGVSFRYINDDIFAVMRYHDDNVMILFVNRGSENKRTLFDVLGTADLMTDVERNSIVSCGFKTATDVTTDKQIAMDSYILSIDIMPYSAVFVKLSK